MLIFKAWNKILTYTIVVHSLKRNASTAVADQQVASGEAIIYDYINVDEILPEIAMETSPAYGTKNRIITPIGSPAAITSTTSNGICGPINGHQVSANIAMETSPAYQTNKEVMSMPGLQEPVPSSLCH